MVINFIKNYIDFQNVFYIKHFENLFLIKLKYVLVFFLYSFVAYSQTTITSKIDNYSNKNVIIYTYNGVGPLYLDKIKTNNSGEFKYTFPSNYNGIIYLLFKDLEESFSVFPSSEKDIHLYGDIYYLKSNDSLNNFFNDYISYNNKGKYVLSYLNTLNEFYPKSHKFSSVLKQEIDKYNYFKLSDKDKYNNENLNTYIEISEALNNNEKDNTEFFKSILLNASDFIISTDIFNEMFVDYFNIKTKDSKDRIKTFELEIDSLLSEADIETSRGQVLLSSIIGLTKRYKSFYTLNQKYLQIAETLKCEISPELKKSIEINKITEGSKFPNFKFSKPINGFKNIYEIENKPYKLIIVWGSWCPHCQQDKPKILSYYNLNKDKLNIVSLSVEYNENEFINFSKDIPWINYSDYKFWGSDYVKEVGIDGTPTFFLLDSNNIILKRSSNFDQIISLIK